MLGGVVDASEDSRPMLSRRLAKVMLKRWDLVILLVESTIELVFNNNYRENLIL